MKTKILALLLGITCGNSALAETNQEDKSFWDLPTHGKFEFRQEYRDGIDQYNNKFQVNLRQGSYILETIAYVNGGSDNDIWSDHKIGSYELGLYHNYKINPQITIRPGFAYAINTNENNLYIPSLRFNYLTNTKVQIEARYKQVITSKNTHRNQAFDLYLGYGGIKDLHLLYQGNITHSVSGNPLFDNKDIDYFHNLKATYKGFNRLQPYAEIGDIKVSPKSNERQLRWRLGIVYLF
ncbi:oligogalacturonate-specific porin KdgM family protein [Photobacterium leiognathi]|uniref:oligogalacturonate-specific porin KdgM family protein n=1 Tax=Photobacterium leiognathi TaxID=553611 RepID=UPI002980A941|nr:oligogalacturonate-specific porin KdgM family protein [Photobacterium leiognathi]